MAILDRFKGAFNAFINGPKNTLDAREHSSLFSSSSYNQLRFSGNDRSIITAIYNQIAVDVSQKVIRHVRKDQNGIYLQEEDSRLNECLTVAANIDQTSTAFLQDIVLTMFNEGAAAIVPVDTTANPTTTNSYDVLSMRVGRVTQWFPSSVEVDVYNDRKGSRETLILPKNMVAIVENPLASVMSGPNSTLGRLTQKLKLLDIADSNSYSGKLDLIIQLPYVVRNEMQEKYAERRRRSIEKQMADSKYGIVYADAAERITQLNRPAENNLFSQIEYWTKLLYSQLGISEEVFNGTASESVMLNYQRRTVKPLANAIALSLKRTFLTKTAMSQGQDIIWFEDPFEYSTSAGIVDMAEKLIRSQVVTSNEIRGRLGYRKSSDPTADELRNPNINPVGDNGPLGQPTEGGSE